eukprot:CAMPEP_0184450660 /NCGR_PEP_ID=MMETSP0740-20130409/5898_1 /TAXON_ID=385413 /ORGANISM="Thalassiosira miniscula, Strain CCMP1093" /LENGTH=33 /DNA_ID= /DNA_START= /DNA_END= /DNA_ORIENTATION=
MISAVWAAAITGETARPAATERDKKAVRNRIGN